MTIATYSDLSTDLQDRMHRSDLSAKISNTVQLLEDEFNRKFRCRQMIATTTLSVAAATVNLPSDFLELRDLSILGGTNEPLKFVTPEQMEVYDRALFTGQPRVYTIRGSVIQFGPPPDSTYSIVAEYYQKIPGLEANSTNWVLTNYPLAYVAGALLILFEYVQNSEVLAWAKQKHDDVMADINRADDNSTYSGSVIRVRADQVA